MTTWNELPAHLVSKIRSDSVTAPANLPGAVPVLKYGNAITEVDGIRFDSRKEAKYYEDLLWQQRTGAVKSIELQPEFVLQPGYEVAGKKIRPIIYRADFKVTEANGHIYYVDTKGMRTQVYLIKKKMLRILTFLFILVSKGLGLKINQLNKVSDTNVINNREQV